MVPSLERADLLYELRNIAENIVNERCKHSAVHVPTQPECVKPSKVSDVEEDVHRPLAANPATVSPPEPNDHNVGPAFHIPMTQEKSLEDLPSQLDFDWQESVTPGPSVTPATARNLGEELDVASTPPFGAQPTPVDVTEFVEVSEIAKEAVMDAIHQDVPDPSLTTSPAAADANVV